VRTNQAVLAPAADRAVGDQLASSLVRGAEGASQAVRGPEGAAVVVEVVDGLVHSRRDVAGAATGAGRGGAGVEAGSRAVS
jgi:hypothetical protein